MCKRSFVIPTMYNRKYNEEVKENPNTQLYQTILFCNCGEKEIVDLKAIPNYNYEDISQLVYEEKIVCTKCGNKEHITLHTGNYHHMFQDLQVFENGDKLSAVAMVGSYFVDKRTGTIRYVNNKFRITVNTTTGKTYLLKGKRIFNISNWNVPSNHHRLISAFLDHYVENPVWLNFLNTCLEKRGISYVTLEDFKNSYNNSYCFSKFFLYLQFPQLQNVKELPLTFIPQKMRKELATLTKKREIYKLFFGTTNQEIFNFIFKDIEKVRKKNKEKESYAWSNIENKENKSTSWLLLHMLSRAIKEPSNLLKLIQLRQPYIHGERYEDYVPQIVTEEDFPPFITDNADFPLGEEVQTNVEESPFGLTHTNIQKEKPLEDLDIRQDDGELLAISDGYYNPNHVFNVEMFEDANGKAYEMIKAFQYFVELFGETTFTNRIVKEITKYQNDKKHLVFYCDNNFYNILVDIYRMHKDIVKQNPVYKARWNKRSFRQIHDILSKDYARYCSETQTIIEYKKNELLLEGELNETYSIKLAPHTKYLVDIGAEMDICVGGYGQQAASKRVMIAVMYKEEKPTVCIEIQKKRIVQAKLHRNNLLEEYEATLVAAWAEQNGLDWKRTCDLDNVNRGLLKQLNKTMRVAV